MIKIDQLEKYGFVNDKHVGQMAFLKTVDLMAFIKKEKPNGIKGYCNTFNLLIKLPKSTVWELLENSAVDKTFLVVWNDANTIEIYPEHYHLTKEIA